VIGVSVTMGQCERCGREFQSYCAKCREELKLKAQGADVVPSEDLVILLAYDKKERRYRYGCSVKECPCNTELGWCSKATPFLDKTMLHDYDGDNAVKQWCG
jgi:hypothetical protein